MPSNANTGSGSGGGGTNFIVTMPSFGASSDPQQPAVPSSLPPIVLFGSDQSTTGNETLPFRSTTYEAKPILPTSLLKGHMYVQDPLELNAKNISTFHWNAMSWSQLYSRGFTNFLAHQRRQHDVKGTVLPPAPPDYDGEQATDVEAVSKYVNGLAAAYAAQPSEAPAPFQIYEHMVSQVVQLSAVAPGLAAANANQSTINTPGHRPSNASMQGDGPAMPLGHSMTMLGSSVAGTDQFVYDNQPLMALMPTHPSHQGIQLEVINFSMLLSNTQNLTTAGLAHLARVLETQPALAQQLPSTLLDALIRSLRADGDAACASGGVGDGGSSNGDAGSTSGGGIGPLTFDQRGVLCSILTRLVLRRKQLGEILQFIFALESLPARSHSSSILPTVLPQLPMELIEQCTLGPFGTSVPSPSPLDVLHQGTRPVPISIPEGVVVTRFCVSHDGRLLAMATSDGILLCDTQTGNVLQAAPAPSGTAAACWCLQFSPDDQELLFSDSTAKHHALYTTKGLMPAQRFDFDNPRIPHYSNNVNSGNSYGAGHNNAYNRGGEVENDTNAEAATTTTLSFVPSPLLPCGKHHCATLRFLSSERINFPIFAQHEPSTSAAAPLNGSNFAAVPAAAVSASSPTTSAVAPTPAAPLPAGSSGAGGASVGADNGVASASTAASVPLIPTEEFCLCAVVDAGFHGVLVTVDAGDELLSLQLRNGVVALVHGGGTCQTALQRGGASTATGGWVFVCASWKSGVWTLFVNGEVAELRGVRMTQSKAIRIQQIYGLCGTGMVATVAGWCGPPTRAVLRSLVTANSLSVGHDDATTVGRHHVRSANALQQIRPLFHIPLDEGSGHWLKELVTRSVIPLNAAIAVWDTSATTYFVAAAPPPPPSSLVSSHLATSSTAEPHNLRLPPHVLLQANVLQSAYSVVLTFPPTQKGSDAVVIVLSDDAARIERTYQDSGDSADALLHLNREETQLFSFVPRFGSFTCTYVSSARKRSALLRLWEAHTAHATTSDRDTSTARSGGITSPVAATAPLPASGRGEDANTVYPSNSPFAQRRPQQTTPQSSSICGGDGSLNHTVGTAQWLADRLHRVLYVEGTQLLRFPSALSPINARNMVTVCAGLRNSTRAAGTSKLKVLSLLTLGVVHFVHLSREQDPVVQSVASMLNVACKQILNEHHNDALISEVASELFRVGVSKSLTPAHKAEVLAEADHPQHTDLLEGYLSKESIGAIVEYLCREDPDMLMRVSAGLLRRCEQERVAAVAPPLNASISSSNVFASATGGGVGGVGSTGGAAGTTTTTAQMLWFVIAVVQHCVAIQAVSVLRDVVTLFLDHAEVLLKRCAPGGSAPSPPSSQPPPQPVQQPAAANLHPNALLYNNTNNNSSTMTMLLEADIAGGAAPQPQPFASLQSTVLHSGFIPLMLTSSQLAPDMFDDALRKRLFQCLRLCRSTATVVPQPQQQPASCGPQQEIISIPDPRNSLSDMSSVMPSPPAGARDATANGGRSFNRPSLNESNAGNIGRQPQRTPMDERLRRDTATSGTSPATAASPPPTVVRFSTRQACDIAPNGSAPWRVLFHLTLASSVTFTKETPGDVTVLPICPATSTVAPPRPNPSSPSHAHRRTPAANADLLASGAAVEGAAPGAAPAPAASVEPNSTKRVISSAVPVVKVSGGTYLLHGTRECSLTVVCHYDLVVDTDYRKFLRDAFFRTLMTIAQHYLVRPPPSDVFLAPLLRHGLCNEALRRNGLQLESDRPMAPTLAMDVLMGEGEGKDVINSMVKALRGVLMPSMRPAVQALLAILIHTGVPPAQAQDELKARWFSGEWGSKLQGENRDEARQSLVALAEWMIANVCNMSSAGALSPIRRSSSSDRRASDFLGRSTTRASFSSSIGDRRSSGGSRRSTSKSSSQQNEVLDHVRALFTKGVTPQELEDLLAARTAAAVTITKGLSIIGALVSSVDHSVASGGSRKNTTASVVLLGASINPNGGDCTANPAGGETNAATAGGSGGGAAEIAVSSMPRNAAAATTVAELTDAEYGVVLASLTRFLAADTSAHIVEGLVGCGGDLEMAVRREFHVVIAAASRGLLEDAAAKLLQPVAQDALTIPAPKGRSVLQLLSLLCHPWDSTDCDFLDQRISEHPNGVAGSRLLTHLEDIALVSMCNIKSPITSPWRNQYRQSKASAYATSGSPDGGSAAGSPLGATQQPLSNHPAGAAAVSSSSSAHADPPPPLTREELMGIADESSLSCLLPNYFSVMVPNIQFSRTDAGVAVERTSAGAVTLRADEGWPLTWCEGLPRIYYFETTLQSPSYRLAVCLAQSRGPTESAGGRQAQDAGGIVFSYDNNGTMAHDGGVGGPQFGDGDTVGCGVVTSTRRVFFTVNGVFLGFVGSRVPDKLTAVFPALVMENQEALRVVVNFGTKAFQFDYRQLHPSLTLHSGPTTACIASAAASVLHVITARACTMHDMRRQEARSFFIAANSIVCEGIRRVTSSLMSLGATSSGADASADTPPPSSSPSSNPSPGARPTVGTQPTLQPTAEDSAATRAQNAVRIAMAEAFILKVVATLRHIVRIAASPTATPLVEDVSESTFKAVSTLMLIPLQSVKVATIGLLPDVLPLIVKQVQDNAACADLVRTLFDLAKANIRVTLVPSEPMLASPASIPRSSYELLRGGVARASTISPQSPQSPYNKGGAGGRASSAFTGNEDEEDVVERALFVPSWLQCDSRCMSITNTQHARMAPEAQRSIVLGSILPRTGTVSFTVRITREGMTKGHSLKGGYFVGIAIATLAPLSPPSNSQSWKVVKPPIVWALHDTSPQLPHAVNPTVKPNNFQRTFGSGDVITVVVNRDAQTIAFYRDDQFLKELYQDVPQHVDLTPFAQLYNDDASVDIGPGTMTPAITSQMLLSAAAVDVLRSMFTLKPFDDHVARHLTNELENDPLPSVTLAVFASLPDPRNLSLQHGINDETTVVVRRVNDLRCKFTLGDSTYFDHRQNLRTPSQPIIRGKIDASFGGGNASFSGIDRCIAGIVRAWARLTTPLVTTQALAASEGVDRRKLFHEERNAWDALFVPRRIARFDQLAQATRSSLKEVARSPPVPHGYAFSQPLSHQGFVFSPRYCGRLVTVPNGSANTTTPFIAIAEPSIPLSGKFSIRCQLIRGHHGQILGGGYYFGVCTSTFTCKRREMNVTPPDVWALHDMEDTPWRLRHLTVDRRLPTAAEPNCLLVSGDVVRLEIDRDECTMHAYRRPANGGEEIFIGFLFDNLPKSGELFPFVHMYNTDAVAVMLPPSPTVPAIRTTVQQPHFALMLSEKRNCDGCVSQHRETKLSGGQQDWYKCNECVDYNLCGYCFGNFVHSHHPFTKMDARMLVHTLQPPTRSTMNPGASLIVAGTSAMYLKSIACTMPESGMSCVAVSHADASLAVWGLVSCANEDPTFTISVKAHNAPGGSVLSTTRPVFVGVGDASEILSVNADELRKRCVTGFTTGISVCSDSRVRRKLSYASISPFGFLSDSTITITVQAAQSRARITRDWIDVGYIAMPSNLNASSRLVGFVLFGSANMTASVAPERTPQCLMTVSEVVNNEVVRVSDPGSGLSRFVAIQDCRVPVVAETGTTVPIDRWYYAFLDRKLTVCRVVLMDKSDVIVCFPQNDTVQRLPVHQLFLPIAGDVPQDSNVLLAAMDGGGTGGSSSPVPFGGGPHMMHGFVMSRLLMILSCMMEDTSLVPLLQGHAATLLPLLHRLASVRISNDAPTQFLPEVRDAVASTAQIPRIQRLLHKLLPPFVPTTTPELEKLHAFPAKPSMLVAIIEGPLRGKMFRCQGDGADTFRAEPLEGGGHSATIKAAACIPVKQCGGLPWWRVPNGLPCSVLEHTLRSEASPLAVSARVNVSVEGEWHGELITSQNTNMSMSLSLRVDANTWNITGTARVAIPDGRVIDTTVKGMHHRYARNVRLTCSYPPAGPHMTNDELRQGLRSFNVTVSPDTPREDLLRKLTALCQHLAPPNWSLRGSLDAEGLRIGGTWKHTEGLSGTFAISALRGVSLAPLSTPLYHIEPLPDCADRNVSLAGPRDVYTVMHRLVVMLARHLYLTLVGRSNGLAKEISKDIIHYHAHPLTERLIAFCVDTQPQRFYRILGEAVSLVMDPLVKPWDSSTLSAIITNSMLLKPAKGGSVMPSVYWDALHAVVAAAHNCGEDYRHKVLNNVIQLIRVNRDDAVGGAVDAQVSPCSDLLTAICTWVNTHASAIVGITPVRRDVAAGIELLLTVSHAIADRTATAVPLASLRCLMDMADSLQQGRALPEAVETSARLGDSHGTLLEVQCPFGQYVDGELKVGKIMSNLRTNSATNAKFYFEVTLPEKAIAAFAVGWGSQQHSDIPSQHVGSDIHSFAFSGNQIVMKQVKEEYKVGADISTGAVVGCLIDLSEKAAAWSVNGIVGPFIQIPITLSDAELHAFTSTGSCSGMKIHLNAHQFQYVPDGYCDLAGRTSGTQISSFDAQRRSSIPVRPVSFYAHVAAYMSDVEAAQAAAALKESQANASSTTEAPTPNAAAAMRAAKAFGGPAHDDAILAKYTQLSTGVTRAELNGHIAVVHVAESCMTTARRFIDLEGDGVTGRLASSFLFMRQLVTRTFRRKLVEIPSVDARASPNPPNITIRFTELFSSMPRNPDVALHHSVLAQLHRQIGAYTTKQLLQHPLVKVHLYMTQSGHAPQDMGGPYRQLWSLLGDEIMTHPDRCYPHSDFHRNPLFRFSNNSQRVALVPDHLAQSPYELVLFAFLGKLLGHMARAKSPLPIDVSPFVWKFLVEDTLTVRDYYLHVDSVVERSINDEEFLLSEVAEDVIPNYAEMIQREVDRMRSAAVAAAATAVVGGTSPSSPAPAPPATTAAQLTTAGGAANASQSQMSIATYADDDDVALPFEVRREVAEACLVHSMDVQLAAIREGMWAILPKRVTRCLCWQDLERSVCGDSLPTMEQMRDAVLVQTQHLRDQFFWRLMEEMTGAQRSAFLCFACGQKRLPLVKRVRVTENTESVEHLPRAQSCSALVTIPCYTSYELFKSKMLVAIEHQSEMELA